MKLWNYLNGKKTFIGSVCFTVYILGVLNGLWGYNQEVVDVLSAIFGIGITHKAFKLGQDLAR